MTKESDSQAPQGQSEPPKSKPQDAQTTGNKAEQNTQQQITANPLDETKSIAEDINTLITSKDETIKIKNNPKKLNITPAAPEEKQEDQSKKDKDDIEKSIDAMYEIRALMNEVLNFFTLSKSNEFQKKLEDKGKEKIQKFNEKLASFRDTIKNFITSKAEKKSVAGTENATNKEPDPAAATKQEQASVENTSTSSSPENLAQQATALSKESLGVQGNVDKTSVIAGSDLNKNVSNSNRLKGITEAATQAARSSGDITRPNALAARSPGDITRPNSTPRPLTPGKQRPKSAPPENRPTSAPPPVKTNGFFYGKPAAVGGDETKKEIPIKIPIKTKRNTT